MDGLELDHIHVSPDGRWVAFNIVDDGRPEVYVAPKMADGRRFRVSLRGGAEPRWSPKTNELYFLGLDGTVMSARYEDAGTDFRVVEHVALFDTGIEVDSQSDQYAVSRDGGRILVKRNRGSDVNILVQHFFAELERLVPAR
jgi:Tol biopolymer transport system component